MLNRGLLLASGKAGGNQTIGEAGGQGFGVGVYGGDPADLDAMGLTPMDGCDDPSSDNYGNYVHTNGSIMCFIPAFCYRIGNPAAPSYARDNENALEIRDASEGEGDGWVLHRAFIDGGEIKSGFFMDKYLCSKDSTGKIAVSVKNGNPICTSTSYINSSSMPGCVGQVLDAITLSRARGEHYACVSAFQWSAMAVLSLAHGQAATSAEFCAWYDANRQTNFPKGNNSSLKDTNDSTVTFTKASGNYGSTSLTGSASNFAKTTHNGQNSGICDINGNKYQPLLGVNNPSSQVIYIPKEPTKMHDFTKEDYASQTLMEKASISKADGSWGWGANAFQTDKSGVQRALFGVYPKTFAGSSTALFGNDYGYNNRGSALVVLASGRCGGGSDAGVFSRDGGDYYLWAGGAGDVGFRAAGYARS